MIITITLNPALDRTLRIEHPLEVGKLNRSSSSHLEPGGKGINVSRAVKALGGNSFIDKIKSEIDEWEVRT